MIVGNPIIMILKAILNWFRLRRDYIANAVDKIPPEIKDALVAWYSPKKQKLNNYDVIESYVTDFTTWRTADKNYVGLTIRSSSFSISFNKVSNHVIMWKSNYLFNEEGQVKLQVSGITNNISIIIKHGAQEFPIVNGVNTFSFTQQENKSLSFVCKNVFQDTNITITQLPTSILKDFSGNGNHAYLYGGKGKLNSGMGLYKVDFTTYINKNNILDIKPNSFITNAGASYINSYYSQIANNIPTYNIKVANLNGSIKYSYKDTDYTDLSVIIEKDGTYNLPISYKVNENKPTGFSINSSTKVTITQIPDYPDQLCYDGKMYAVAYGLPILTDYTIIADRTWFNYIQRACFLSKILHAGKGAFGFEIFNEKNEYGTYSFGIFNDVAEFDKNIVYQTKKSYNGRKSLIHGSVSITDYDELYLGKLRSNENNMFIGCHGDILLFNRTLTDDELDLVKEHFFGIESNIKDALMTTDKKNI